ncbi:MAG: hypothetical protein U0840_20220 [Gemmataceae bacterium]
MNQQLVRSVRPRLERLEERTTPTITPGTLVVDGSGNLTATLTVTESILDLDYDGTTSTLSIGENNGPPVLIVAGVVGNVNLTINVMNNTADFQAQPTFTDTFAGNYTLTINQPSSAFDADVVISGATAATILGNVSITTNAADGSDVVATTTAPLNIVGNVTVRMTGGTAADEKSITLPTGAGAWLINGGLTASGISFLDINDGNVIGGTVTATFRASSTTPTNFFELASGSVAGNLSLTMGNVSGTGGSDVNLSGQVNGFTTIKLGTNTTANTTNRVDFDGFSSLGTLISITAGNGGKLITFNNVTAGLAQLTVSLGNAAAGATTRNQVNFTGTNSFAYVTLIGGLGSNVVSGTIPSPFRLIRFSF